MKTHSVRGGFSCISTCFANIGINRFTDARNNRHYSELCSPHEKIRQRSKQRSKDFLLIFAIIALVIIVLIVLWAVSAYNGLVTLRNRVKNGWAQIDVQLKQRADLIPNLVETVKGYAAHESQVFTQVTQARANALQAAQSGDVNQRIEAENQLSRAILNLQAVAEAYPQLQANQNFLDLQAQLKSLEEKIAYARQFYNDVVQKYNTKIEVVPTNIIAGLFHFEQAAYFQVDEADRQAPQVKF